MGGLPPTEFLCIYCRAPLTGDTARAHVIPQCLGGRLWSESTCCTRCNNALGVLERGLCEELRLPGAALGARNTENQLIRATIESEGKAYEYEDGLGQEILPKPKRTREGVVFPLPGDERKQAAEIAKMLWERGATPADIDAGKLIVETDTTFGIKPHPPEARRVTWVSNLGSAEHMRVITKMGLELLALRRPHEARRWEVLRTARRFIMHDEGVLPVRFEALSQGSGLLRSTECPILAHAVEVWTSKRNLNFRVTLFGGLHLTGTLTTGWTGPCLSIAHALDPIHPATRIDKDEDADGPSLELWYPELREQAFNAFSEWFDKQTRLVSKRVVGGPWKPPSPPDLARLRTLIEEEYAKLRRRKKQPKRAGKK